MHTQHSLKQNVFKLLLLTSFGMGRKWLNKLSLTHCVRSMRSTSLGDARREHNTRPTQDTRPTQAPHWASHDAGLQADIAIQDQARIPDYTQLLRTSFGMGRQWLRKLSLTHCVRSTRSTSRNLRSTQHSTRTACSCRFSTCTVCLQLKNKIVVCRARAKCAAPHGTCAAHSRQQGMACTVCLQLKSNIFGCCGCAPCAAPHANLRSTQRGMCKRSAQFW
jgi:hypothetical protein